MSWKDFFMVLIAGLAIMYMVAHFNNAKADVRSACQNSYMTYCSHTEPFSKPCRACMRRVGRAGRLSKNCLRALNTSGRITARDRRVYKRRRRR